jgi:hypothetical protein
MYHKTAVPFGCSTLAIALVDSLLTSGQYLVVLSNPVG